VKRSSDAMGIWSNCPGLWVSDADLELAEAAKRLRNARLKRVMDFTGAAAGLVVFLPFLLLVTAAIFIDSPGPIIFRQRRTGYDGVPFFIYKFRTMTVLADGPNIRPAVRGDGRSTRIGRLLRRTSIDELPQLLNVLKGEMSLVGPRPHAIAHDEHYAVTVPGYNARFMARPGITGLAQVSGFRGEIAHCGGMAERVAYDLEYIRTWSLELDTKILWRTLAVVVSSTAY
jgi:putative colanic acid biosynthesis UDP-glucose lipid carrier transferase